MPALRSPRALPEPVDVGPLQWRCLEALYARNGTGTVADVHKVIALQQAKAGQSVLAYTTILTVMRNLARRKVLTQRRQDGGAPRLGRGASHVFQVTISRPEFLRRRAHLFLASFFGGDVQALVQAVA